jgi:hypothetical protein
VRNSTHDGKKQTVKTTVGKRRRMSFQRKRHTNVRRHLTCCDEV